MVEIKTQRFNMLVLFSSGNQIKQRKIPGKVNRQMNRMNKLILILVLLMLSPGPSRSQTRPMALSNTRAPLLTGWQFREAGKDKWSPASVPGCVHTDLLNNKLID